jgi:hypothetical protein
MEQSQERIVAPKADRTEPDVAARRPRELSYGMAQVIALLVTAGVLVAVTLLIVLLAG